jgi:hypothetical protein
VVKALAPEEIELEKIDRLRSHLAGAVRAATQLDVKPGEAIRIFRQMLEKTKED